MGKKQEKVAKQRILGTAEKLFSEKGYDATSVDEISRKARVNKALIYYYFENKEAIKQSLFEYIIAEVRAMITDTFMSIDNKNEDNIFLEKFKRMVQFLENHRGLIAIMFMESLKANDKTFSLFQCADIIINNEIDGIIKNIRDYHPEIKVDTKDLMVHEFFTGFIPIIVFVLFRKKWAAYFNYSDKKLFKSFVEAFKQSHLASHFGHIHNGNNSTES